MRKFSKSHHGSLNELNITPLLDLVMTLLVIFIISTPQMANEMEMNLPTSENGRSDAAPPPDIQYVAVEADGSVFLNNQPYSLDRLRELLALLRSRNPDVSVVVRGHEEADYQHVIDVLDILQQVDITNLGLATETGLRLGP